MTHVLTLPENINGRDFVVGDVHGAYDILVKALKEAQFDPARDRLISVGDLIDRGPQSPAAAIFLEQPWFFAVRGNHEDMFLDICHEDGTLDIEAARANVRNGMGWVFDETSETLADLRAAFEKMPIAIEAPTSRGTVGFVHAEVPANMDWATFKEKIKDGDARVIQEALWGRSRVNGSDPRGVAGIDRLFSGHTPQENGPRRLGNCYYIDTGSVFRAMGGDQAPEYILTLSDVTAKSLVIPGPAARPADQHKVITDVPPKKKPFGKYGPAI